MATISIAFTSVCAGGCHLVVSASINGGQSLAVRLDADDIRAALNADEAPDFIAKLLRVAFAGKTRAQAKSMLQAGINVTL